MDCITCKERMAELHFDPTYHYRGTRYGLSSCDVCPNYDPEDNQPVQVVVQPCNRDHDIAQIKGNLISLRDTLKQHVTEPRTSKKQPKKWA